MKKEELNSVNSKLDKINRFLSKSEITELLELVGNKRKLLIRNLIAGISRGVGIGIGVTLITSLIVFLLQRLVKLNIPVIGEYITDIIEIVKNK